MKANFRLFYTPDFVSDCPQIHIHYPEAPGLHPAGREGPKPEAVTRRRASRVGGKEEEEQGAGGGPA